MKNLFTSNLVNTPEESHIYRPDPVKRLESIKAKIIDFINYGNPHTLTVQLWRLPENGGYSELELNDPIVNADNETLTINDIDDTTPALTIALCDMATINYSVNWFTITLKNGECVKLVIGGGC